MKKKSKNYLQILGVLMFLAFSAQAIAQEKNSNGWVAPEEANKVVNPLKGNAEATKAGKKLYKQQCAICHGDTGKGDGVAGMSLTPKPTNFTLEKVQAETDGGIFWKLTNGKAPMAAYKDILTEEQRWQLVNYIRTLSK